MNPQTIRKYQQQQQQQNNDIIYIPTEESIDDEFNNNNSLYSSSAENVDISVFRKPLLIVGRISAKILDVSIHHGKLIKY